MQKGYLIVLTVSLALWGCAPKAIVVKPEPSPSSVLPSTPPPLTTGQLLGLHNPHGMISDPETGQFALKEVMEAYWKLKEQAAHSGWHLILVSGHRTFYSQRRIWNKFDKSLLKMSSLDQKSRVRAIMSVVSVPGLSRHHWGTDMDISEESLRGRLMKIQPDTPKRVLDFYRWMEENAPHFGFCKVYLGKKGAVIDEPWHWSYFPYSRVYEQQFLGIKDFNRIMDVKVAEVNYLMRNFPQILKRENQSINTDCQVDAPR